MCLYDSVLVATDGSDDATVAVEHAVSLARRLECSLHGIAVIETDTASDTGGGDLETTSARQRTRAEAALATLERRARTAGLSVVTVRQTGTAHEEILAYADTYDSSVIVVGARGHSACKRAVLGSTTDALVRRSRRPVLVVISD